MSLVLPLGYLEKSQAATFNNKKIACVCKGEKNRILLRMSCKIYYFTGKKYPGYSRISKTFLSIV